MSFTSAMRIRLVPVGVISRALSFFACEALLVAASLHLYNTGASPLAVSLLFLGMVVPTIVSAPVVGYCIDRFDRRKLVIGASAAAMVAALALVQVGTEFAVIALTCLIAVAHSIIAASWQATFPAIAGSQDLTSVLGLSQTASTLANSVAPAIVGFIVASYGFRSMTVVLIACYGSVAVMGFFSTGMSTADAGLERSDGWAGGFSYLFRNAVAWRLLVILSAVALFVGATNVVEVFLLRRDMGASNAEFGIVAAMWAVGLIIGGRLAAMARSDTRMLSFTYWSALLAALCTIGVGVSANYWIAAAFFLLGGVGNGVITVTVAAAIIGAAPAHLRGRCAAALNASANSAMVLAFLLGGVISIWMSPRLVYIAAGVCAAALTGLIGLRLLQRGAAPVDVTQ